MDSQKFENAKETFLAVWLENKKTEDGIKKLRDAGYSQIYCVRVLKEVLNLSLSEADDLVLLSKAWADQKEITDYTRDSVIEGLNSDLSNTDNKVDEGK